MNRTIISTCVVLLCSSWMPIFAATIVDQSQTGFSATNDISLSGRTGQTFTTGVSAPLVGLRLLVEGKGFSGNPVFGSDITVSIRSTLNGTPTSNILASGTLLRSNLIRNTPIWVAIEFDQPYQQTAGALLAYTILETSGGGAAGFNEYGELDGNPYSSGRSFITYTEGQALSASTKDYAFETLVAPEPNALVLLLSGGLTLGTRRRSKCR